MGMTKLEKFAKDVIYKNLYEGGYVTYAKLFYDYDFNFTSDPNTVAYMAPAQGKIVVNRGLDASQISVIVRHEILHFYLRHEKRLLNKLAKDRNLDPDKLDDLTISELKRYLYRDATFNIAADYEISNKAYTDDDKYQVRNINLNGNIVSGLVTEDKHPDWLDLSVEEMFEKLKEEPEIDDSDEVYGVFIDDTTFIQLPGGIVYGI